ncbi:MAG: DUF4105 domain-containing protein [Paludibacteraceae bacterium]|nr:DUF4105 domain-containing protein [Paludibacteraceae bacterium]MBN2788356.1 DUF4105 domain-containing protein [Paludibacteraceae bacterium]
MKKILLFVLCFFCFTFSFSETLSDKAQISLLTCGSGKELYAQFGHTAIRIYDPELTIDVAFNYGMFNFSTEGFYLKFVKGITDYELGLEFAIDFFIKYQNREVDTWEQILVLTPKEKQRIFDALMLNYEPQNRFYRYNFVYDNCATRPRDMIEQAIGDTVIYPDRNVHNTFRQLVAGCVGTDNWTKFALDIVLGASADKVATPRERMFLPLELMFYMQDAKRKDGQKIVVSTTQVYKAPTKEVTTPFVLKPVVVCFAVLFLIGLISYVRRNKNMLWLDAILFTISGVMGIIVFYLSFISVHPIVSENYNLLWMNPLQLVFVLLLPFKSLRKLLSYYQLVNVIAILIAIGGYVFLPQEFNVAFLPIMLLLVMRSLFFMRYQKIIIP